MRMVVNPVYDYMTSFLEALPDFFDKEGETIYNERNHLKVFTVGNEKVVVKSFKIPFFFNRIIYAHFSASKAERSYKYALKLIEKQINTPQPIAYIERKKKGLLTDSYYISVYKDNPGILRELRYHTLEEKRDMVSSFVRFTVDIHEKGVYPLDYSPGNIIYEKVGDRYNFCLIDINRMQFKPVDIENGAYGLRRLWGNEETIAYIAREYAMLRQFDEEQFKELTLKYHRLFWKKYSKKHGGFQPYNK